jgi:hypothetical protein
VKPPPPTPAEQEQRNLRDQLLMAAACGAVLGFILGAWLL